MATASSRSATSARGSAKSEIVILMLGETGVGKSTSINSFNIYLRCGTLEEAELMKADDLFLIPMKFSGYNPETYDEVTIAVGKKEDDNEFHENTGDSVTQDPKIHVLKLPDVTMTIIDTPGIGDTRGQDKDKENAQSILRCIADFQYLDAICVFLKPSDTRLNDRFKYCLKEILRNLHENAKANIVICITNGKAVNYAPGETIAILKKFMAADEILKDIEISGRTVYYLENEPVRYLAKVKCGTGNASVEERRSAIECWEKSVDQVTKMFHHIAQLPIHMTIGMTSINDSRRAIARVTPLLVEVTTCIVKNVKAIDKQAATIELKTKQIRDEPQKHAGYDLKDLLYIEEYEIIVEKLDHTMTVCVSAACSRYVNGRLVHTQECDPRCRFAPTLRTCEAMNFVTGKCKRCSCHCREHEWKTSRTTVRVNRRIDPEVVDKILDKDEALQMLQRQLQLLKHNKSQYIKEKRAMLVTCAKLSIFLEQNALMKKDETNDFLHYLTRHIAVIRQTSPVDEETQETLTELQQLRDEYNDKQSEMSGQKRKYGASDVKQLIDGLFKLPLVGKKLQKGLHVAESSRAEAIEAAKLQQVHSFAAISCRFQGVFGKR